MLSAQLACCALNHSQLGGPPDTRGHETKTAPFLDAPLLESYTRFSKIQSRAVQAGRGLDELCACIECFGGATLGTPLYGVLLAECVEN